MLTFREAGDHLKAKRAVLTGLPVRPEILTAEREEALRDFGFDAERFTILIVGGSLGASSMNRAALTIMQSYQGTPVQFIWVTGKKDYEEIHHQAEIAGYLKAEEGFHLLLYPYLYEMEKALAAADLVVCRCGATTLSEIETVGVPAVLIPYPYASENHQEKNGMSLVKNGAGVMVLDRELTGSTLKEQIESIRLDPAKQERMRENMKKLAQPDSLKKIIDEIERGIQAKKHRG